jgi:hypothetical protein
VSIGRAKGRRQAKTAGLQVVPASASTVLASWQIEGLLEGVKRLKFDPKLVQEASEGITWDGKDFYNLTNQDVALFADNNGIGPLIAGALGHTWNPSERVPEGLDVRTERRRVSQWAEMYDPDWEAAWELIEEPLWDRWSREIFKVVMARSKAVQS